MVSLWRSLPLLLLVSHPAPAEPMTGGRFLYLSDQRVVTLEVFDSTQAVLNYINLGNSYEMLQAASIAVLDSQGVVWPGQVFEDEDAKDPRERFLAGSLIPPGGMVGFTLRGRFGSSFPPETALMEIGGRILKLEVLSEDAFEMAAARISEMNLTQQDRKLMIQLAGFQRGFGRMFFSGTEEAAPFEDRIPRGEVLPPLLVSNPKPRLSSKWAHLPDPVVVQLRAQVSRSGAVFNVQVQEGVDPEIDEMAVQTVENSWVFLPAISRGSVADAEVTLNVVFERLPPGGG